MRFMRLKWLGLVVFCLLVNACGQAGKLYLPEHSPQHNSEKV